MKHWTREEGERYVSGRMPAEERDVAEQHLYVCDLCMALYMACLEDGTARLPQLSDQEAFTEAVMAQVKGKRPRSRSWRQRPFLQYVVAAAITLILMSTGLFENMATEFNQLQASQSGRQESFSEKLVERTAAILDRVQPDAINGGMFK